MPKISENNALVTVIVHQKFEPALYDRVLEASKSAISRFEGRPGFVSLSLHASKTGRLVSYLQWETVADHEACVNDPTWQTEPCPMQQLLESGQLEMDVAVYDVVKTVEVAALTNR